MTDQEAKEMLGKVLVEKGIEPTYKLIQELVAEAYGVTRDNGKMENR